MITNAIFLTYVVFAILDKFIYSTFRILLLVSQNFINKINPVFVFVFPSVNLVSFSCWSTNGPTRKWTNNNGTTIYAFIWDGLKFQTIPYLAKIYKKTKKCPKLNNKFG
jgi:hypothetical protein